MPETLRPGMEWPGRQRLDPELKEGARRARPAPCRGASHGAEAARSRPRSVKPLPRLETRPREHPPGPGLEQVPSG